MPVEVFEIVKNNAMKLLFLTCYKNKCRSQVGT